MIIARIIGAWLMLSGTILGLWAAFMVDLKDRENIGALAGLLALCLVLIAAGRTLYGS